MAMAFVLTICEKDWRAHIDFTVEKKMCVCTQRSDVQSGANESICFHFSPDNNPDDRTEQKSLHKLKNVFKHYHFEIAREAPTIDTDFVSDVKNMENMVLSVFVL